MSEIAMSVNAKNIVDGCSEEKTVGNELRKPRFQWTSKQCPNVATVRPYGVLSQPTTSPSPIVQSIEVRNASTNRSLARLPEENREPLRSGTVPCPFSFDARDSVKRAAFEKRMADQRREMQQHDLELVSKFRANPVRKYKPLVLTKSTQPLVVPQSPFSSRDA
ncbi:siaz-interacting nuclear protein isoform X2 [Brachyhypopomus gauderio]|uniref:siaz-interacting nuclear protein isoform X2 n=1 Tax=Brachyhypopomus gauderio TaxID=698409 RepID=UPI004040F7DE